MLSKPTLLYSTTSSTLNSLSHSKVMTPAKLPFLQGQARRFNQINKQVAAAQLLRSAAPISTATQKKMMMGINGGQSMFKFSTNNAPQSGETPAEVIIETDPAETEPVISQTEKREFKAETKKLLDIVARSIYTDKEVFLRELMSNSSDALEKQRYGEISGQAKQYASEGLYINIQTNEKERTLTIFDSGIGMTRQEVTDNLGIIAKSGSQEFVKTLQDKNQGDTQTMESIIGQFGVGFYSTFIVADSVEVLSKSDKEPHGVRWISDGSGDFEVSTADNVGFERGTKIHLKLKPESREFCKESEIEKILKKHSNFITYPIKLNGQIVNNLQAIWYRDRKEVTEDEYERFFEHLANTKIPYKFKLHYSTDVPLAIKAVFYVPSSHGEKMGMNQETL